MAQKEFAEKYIQDSEIVQTIWKVFKVVPPILQSLGKVSNPWPNVDAHSGALLVHYGMDQYSFYTVLFGVSRALGVLSALCWSRALSLPLERPKSVTIEWVKEFVENPGDNSSRRGKKRWVAARELRLIRLFLGLTTNTREETMQYPDNLKYTKEHEWILVDGSVGIIGITEFAQSELGEIVYVEVDTVGESIARDEVFGTVEAVKTTSDLFMPVSGKVIAFNEEIDEKEGDNPAVINEDPYGKGWIIKVELSDLSELDKLMDAAAYKELVG